MFKVVQVILQKFQGFIWRIFRRTNVVNVLMVRNDIRRVILFYIFFFDKERRIVFFDMNSIFRHLDGFRK